MPEPLMTVAQVAESLHVTPWWVYQRLVYGGGVPHYKIGGTIRFDPDEIESYKARQRVNGGQDAAEAAPVAAGQ